MSNWREGSTFKKELMVFKMSDSFFYTQNVAYFVQNQVILIRSNPTYLRCIADQTRSKSQDERLPLSQHLKATFKPGLKVLNGTHLEATFKPSLSHL